LKAAAIGQAPYNAAREMRCNIHFATEGGVNMATQHDSSRLREITAGLTTFAAMSYIMFTNSSILHGMKTPMPAAPVFLWTCLIAAIASFTSAVVLKKVPSALACGMGLNLFIVTYSDYNGVPWPYLLIVCGVVSVAVFWTSLTSFRYNLLKAVPAQIIAAIKAGVGAILATVPIHEIGRFAKDQDKNGHVAGPILALFIFALGLIVIFGIKLLCANMTRKSDVEEGVDQVTGDAQMSSAWMWDILDSGAFFLSIIVLIFVIWTFHPPQNFSVEERIYITWGTAGALLSPFHGQYLTNSIGFAIAVFVMMTIDIAGSPIDYFRQNFVAKNDQEAAKLVRDHLVAGDDIVVIGDEEQGVLIRKGLRIDSVFNVVAAGVAGMSRRLLKLSRRRCPP